VEKKNPIEIITPPNTLKAKLGGLLNINSAEAIARAERALENLSHEFNDWLDEEIGRVEAAWDSAKDLSDRENQLTGVYGASHDLKGLATTYGYPLITRYANSLCKLLGTAEARSKAPAQLIDAHVKACRTAMRQNIKAPDHPVGLALAQELEAQIDAYVEAE
jgi:hypothetical protein